MLATTGSITADYLNGTRAIPLPAKRRKGNGHKLTVHGARANNLRNVTASIPLGTFTCVTGVSGSGKSTILNLAGLIDRAEAELASNIYADHLTR